MSLFGNLGSTAPKPSLFGGFGASTQQSQPQQQGTSSIFGGNQNQTQQQSNPFSSTQTQVPQLGGPSLLGGQNQTQQSSSIFGQTQNQAPQQGGSSIFGGGQNQTQQPTQSIFGGGQNQTQQPSQGIFGGGLQQNQQSQTLNQPAQNLNMSLNFSTSHYQPQNNVPKNVQGQMLDMIEQWRPENPQGPMQYYFYNKVDEHAVPFYVPSQQEDPKGWEAALSKKPGPGYIPVLCKGFTQIGERIQLQQRYLAAFNSRLHEINGSLEAMLNSHDTDLSLRTLDAKRRHTALKSRCLVLATKVQVLRNKGYAMGADEEDLKAKLVKLERGIMDPALTSRGEDIWARMVGVRERARLLQAEMSKRSGGEEEVLDEETIRRTEKYLEDCSKQLIYLKKEAKRVQEEFEAWQKEEQRVSGAR